MKKFLNFLIKIIVPIISILIGIFTIYFAEKSSRSPEITIIKFISILGRPIDYMNSNIFKIDPTFDRFKGNKNIKNNIENLLTIKNSGKIPTNPSDNTSAFIIRIDVKSPFKVFAIGIDDISYKKWRWESEISDENQIIEVNIFESLLPEKEIDLKILYFIENEEKIEVEENNNYEKTLRSYFRVHIKCPQCRYSPEDKWPKSIDKK